MNLSSKTILDMFRTDKKYDKKTVGGIEIETCVECVDCDLGPYIATEDASIVCKKKNPVEYITLKPYPIVDIMDKNTEIGRATVRLMERAYGCRSVEGLVSCGTHVHMSRKGITKEAYPHFHTLMRYLWIAYFQPYCLARFYRFQNRHLNTRYSKLSTEGDRDTKYQMFNELPSKLGKTWRFEFRGYGEMRSGWGENPIAKEYLKILMNMWTVAVQVYDRRWSGLDIIRDEIVRNTDADHTLQWVIDRCYREPRLGDTWVKGNVRVKIVRINYGDNLMSLESLDTKKTYVHRINATVYLKQEFGETMDEVTCIAVDADNIVSGSGDVVNVWDREGELVRTLAHTDAVSCVAMDADNIVSGSNDVKVWDREGKLVMTLEASEVNCVAMNADYIVCGSDDVKVWDREGKLIMTLEGHKNGVESVAIHGNTIVSGGWDNKVKVWEDGNLRTLEGHTDVVQSVQIYGDNVISGSDDGTVRIWKGSECVKILQGHTEDMYSIAVNEDYIVAGYRTMVIIWDRKTYRYINTLQDYEDEIRSVAIDGNKVVSGSDRVTVWKVSKGFEDFTLLAGQPFTKHTSRPRYRLVPRYRLIRRRKREGESGTFKRRKVEGLFLKLKL